MSMNRSVNLSSDIRVVHTLLLAYNAYDGNWTWNYIYTAFLNGNEKGSKEAHGKFEKWSSHSNTLPCSYSNLNSNHLDEIKLLYDAIVNTINATLAEKGYNFTLENFGLEQ